MDDEERREIKGIMRIEYDIDSINVHFHVILEGNGDKMRLFNVSRKGPESCFILNPNLIELKKI